MINLAKKKILITGAHGFLGKELAKLLLAKKVPKKNLFLPTAKDLDLRKWGNCQKAVRNQEIVIHLAAKVGGIGFNQENPGELFYDNAIMGIQLMEAARKAGIEKFVAIGTICCYPKFTPVPFKEEKIWDGYPEETNAPYGLAKKMLLVQSQAYRSQYGFNSIFLMPVNMYGPGDNFDPKSSHVIPAIIKKCLDAKKDNEKEVVLWGSGKATREFLYIEDAAKGIVLATKKYNKTDPINLGSGKEISIKNLALLIKELTGFSGKIVWNKAKPDGQPRRCLDVKKAKEEFGFEANTDFKKGLKKTIQWYIND
ncbi:GDP-L-fucose synthase [bacterium]|nr:MAG: GDP-L-fucose synthase [bacterium]